MCGSDRQEKGIARHFPISMGGQFTDGVLRYTNGDKQRPAACSARSVDGDSLIEQEAKYRTSPSPISVGSSQDSLARSRADWRPNNITPYRRRSRTIAPGSQLSHADAHVLGLDLVGRHPSMCGLSHVIAHCVWTSQDVCCPLRCIFCNLPYVQLSRSLCTKLPTRPPLPAFVIWVVPLTELHASYNRPGSQPIMTGLKGYNVTKASAKGDIQELHQELHLPPREAVTQVSW